ncbi:hypothetical protein KHA93_11620 [Bacillus sp. FJAT-49732]|uniref:Uncharacterized protein n=1 Tax=Lederbergia citrisecunda TaxID=2833583 RepID=A0A942TR11_9BACI|nr:hypothetical protein [Lederbergia citrisecunda]MBS4200279.1 hypothetical protein [Lederbergia citrisecunda]
MVTFRSNPPPEPPLLKIEPFKGMNTSVTPTQIDESQSPDMLNMNIDERGALKKRTGYERVYVQSLGAGKINGIFHWNNKTIISHGGKLYGTEGVPTLNTRSQTWEDDNLNEKWEG